MTQPSQGGQPPHGLQQQRQQHRVAPTTGGGFSRISVRSWYRPTRHFKGLIELVRAAEGKMAAAGIASVPDQIKTLRGIYYGSPWSEDYRVEHSSTRNAGFAVFTGTVGNPTDPRPILDQGLFDALRQSQDVTDGMRGIDFGHAIIGLDARESAMARGLPLPGFGGTGLEIVTWLGDLGGGAGHLAIARTSSPSAKVSVSFSGTDYGSSNNLEGDVAGYVIARGLATTVAAPDFSATGSLSAALEAYLTPGSPGPEWEARARIFLEMMGAGAGGTVADESSFVATMSDKIRAFAYQYLTTRRIDGRLSQTAFNAALNYVEPASAEVAETFVHELEDCAPTGAKLVAKRFPPPHPASGGGLLHELEQWARPWL
ncbi:MAG: hypothetical protein FWD17_07420 [Polyangiaceae bacterium]|nr:hypothetical protein [Polyangiaceae bacterium]